MKKVLILAYDFPPLNSIGGQRPYSWYKYFINYNIYPIVITRIWDENIMNSVDIVKDTITEKQIETSSNGIIIRTPFSSNIRDKFLLKYGSKRHIWIRRFITFLYNYLEYQSLLFDNKSNILFEADNYLSTNRVDVIIATGEPFILFKYADILSKKHNIPWFADYRDGWSSNMDRGSGIYYNLLQKKDYLFEKKYVESSTLITIAPPELRKDINRIFPNKRIENVTNGYFSEEFKDLPNENINKTFTIAYAGTIYSFQPLELFLDGVRSFINKYKVDNIQVIFYGGDFNNEQKLRIERSSNGIIQYIKTTPRYPKKRIIEELNKSHLLLLLASDIVKNTYAKVFEYLMLKKRILMVKDDFGFLSKIIDDCNAGVKCNSVPSVENEISIAYFEWVNNGFVKSNTINTDQYSRNNQTKNLSELIETTIPQSIFIAPKPYNSREKLFKIMHLLGVKNILHLIKPQKNKTVVVTFHRISEVRDFAYPPISPVVFEGIIKYISSHFEVTTFSKLENNRKSNKPRLIITFDDGYKDFIKNALPILKKYNLPAVNNVIVNSIDTGELFWTQRLNAFFNFIYINKKTFTYSYENIQFSFSRYSDKTLDQLYKQIYNNLLHLKFDLRQSHLDRIESLFPDYYKVISPEMMNWDDLVFCIENNIEIGSHSMSHDSLKTITDISILQNEIANSKKILEEKLGVKIISFAFPNGEYNDLVIKESIKSGYTFLQTTQDSFFDYNATHNHFLVPRYQLYCNGISENIFKISNFHSLSSSLKWH